MEIASHVNRGEVVLPERNLSQSQKKNTSLTFWRVGVHVKRFVKDTEWKVSSLTTATILLFTEKLAEAISPTNTDLVPPEFLCGTVPVCLHPQN